MDNGRRILYSPQFVDGFRVALREAKADLQEMHFRHLCELAELRREVGELRSILQDVIWASREKADADVAGLRHELETALARLERNPNKPLN
jgi:hypothetical protein